MANTQNTLFSYHAGNGCMQYCKALHHLILHSAHLCCQEMIERHVCDRQWAGQVSAELAHVAGVFQPKLRLEASLEAASVQNLHEAVHSLNGIKRHFMYVLLKAMSHDKCSWIHHTFWKCAGGLTVES